jgi:hypothetical protein
VGDSAGLSDRRARHTEEAFAGANEKIAERADELHVPDPPVLCECSSPSCSQIIRVPRAAYSRARAEGWFLVAPHHDDQAVERIVEATGEFVTVEKLK